MSTHTRNRYPLLSIPRKYPLLLQMLILSTAGGKTIVRISAQSVNCDRKAGGHQAVKHWNAKYVPFVNSGVKVVLNDGQKNERGPFG